MSTGRERSGLGQIPVMSIVVNGEQLVVDQRTLTMRERQMAKSALSKLDYDADDLDALCATIWVVMRRNDSALTFEDVCDSLTMESLADATEVDESSPEA